MDALRTLAQEEKIQNSMVNDVFLAVGKLTNTIVSNLAALPHVSAFFLLPVLEMRSINC